MNVANSTILGFIQSIFLSRTDRELFADINKLKEYYTDDLEAHRQRYSEHFYEAETFTTVCIHCGFGFYAAWHVGGMTLSPQRKAALQEIQPLGSILEEEKEEPTTLGDIPLDHSDVSEV